MKCIETNILPHKALYLIICLGDDFGIVIVIIAARPLIHEKWRKNIDQWNGSQKGIQPEQAPTVDHSAPWAHGEGAECVVFESFEELQEGYERDPRVDGETDRHLDKVAQYPPPIC